MSHFTSVKTKIVELEYLREALQDLKLEFQEGDLTILDFEGNTAEVQLKVKMPEEEYDIGLRKVASGYEIVADWFGIESVEEEEFLQQVNQRYAYHAVCSRLGGQGYNKVEENVSDDGRIHLTLRRIA